MKTHLYQYLHRRDDTLILQCAEDALVLVLAWTSRHTYSALTCGVVSALAFTQLAARKGERVCFNTQYSEASPESC
eukprot:244888-Rhodomonas_salina.3